MDAQQMELAAHVADFLAKLDVRYCQHAKTRVGGENDGGYVVVERFCNQADVLLSFGIGDDVSFEKDFAKRFSPKKIFLCDPNVDSPDVSPFEESFKFLRWGAKTLSEAGGSLAKAIGIDLTYSSMLKMDVEFGEWDAILRTPEEVFKRFLQIVIELHVMLVPPNTQNLSPYFSDLYRFVNTEMQIEMLRTFKMGLSRLLQNHVIVHGHPNNSLPKQCVAGYEFPQLIELTLVRRDLIATNQPTLETFPTEWDAPNKTDRPDIAWTV